MHLELTLWTEKDENKRGLSGGWSKNGAPAVISLSAMQFNGGELPHLRAILALMLVLAHDLAGEQNDGEIEIHENFGPININY